MKGFLKFIGSLLAVFGAVIGALAIFDSIANKNRIKGEYLECDSQDDEIVIENTETRDQPKNKENALRLLRSQLYEIELEKRRAETAKIEAGKKKIEWGSQIRSYVFDDRRVKDHRTDYQTSNVQAVMDGNIDEFIKAYLMEFGGSDN